MSYCVDLIIINGSVRTMDPTRPQAEALAVSGNRVVAVGTNEEIRPMAGPSTRVIDAAHRLILPGFNDAHVHFLMGGFSLTNVALRDARSAEEMVARLRAYAEKMPSAQWILGGDWDHENWPGAPLPTRQLVDAVTPAQPVLLNRLDGHMALANSAALRLAGITSQTAAPPGGVIIRDPRTAEPTGLLKDAAISLVERVIPPKTFAEKLAAARAATQFAARCGVTSVTDMSAGEDVAVYQELLQLGELQTRIYATHSIIHWERLAQVGIRAGFGNDLLRIGALKGFADGSLGSSTALFFEPYADDPANRGLLFDQMLPEGVMFERVLAADRHGLQVIIHAIGDEANFRILDLYLEAAKQNGPRDRRFRIEHAQHLRPGDIRRFGMQHVIASVQPYHAADDGRWCEKRVGSERAQTTYAFRALLDSNAALAFGSDWTVAPLNPLLGIKAALTRQTLDGRHPKGWVAEQKIALDEAVSAYTMGSAYAEFTEQVKGSITPGKLADLVMLDRDIYTIPANEIDSTRVIMTVMDGKVVYDAS